MTACGGHHERTTGVVAQSMTAAGSHCLRKHTRISKDSGNIINAVEETTECTQMTTVTDVDTKYVNQVISHVKKVSLKVPPYADKKGNRTKQRKTKNGT